jgi:hypothetical protein
MEGAKPVPADRWLESKSFFGDFVRRPMTGKGLRFMRELLDQRKRGTSRAWRLGCAISPLVISVACLAAGAATVTAAEAAAATAVQSLPPAQAVIGALQKDGQGPHEQGTDAARLLDDIEHFRRQHANLPPQAAAGAWLGLYDRAVSIDARAAGDASAIDIVTRRPVGVLSVIAALPAPAAWPALRAKAAARARKSPDRYQDQALELLALELSGDRAAVDAKFKAVDRAIKQLAPPARALPGF